MADTMQTENKKHEIQIKVNNFLNDSYCAESLEKWIFRRPAVSGL